MNKKMNSTKYSAKQILDFYIASLLSHNYSKDIFLSEEENKERKRNKKKDGINFEYYCKNIFSEENKNDSIYGLRFSNNMINKDEEGRKYVFINDGWDVIMQIDETEDNPEFSRMDLTDLKRK